MQNVLVLKGFIDRIKFFDDHNWADLYHKNRNNM